MTDKHTIDEKVVSFIRSRVMKYFPKTKKVTSFDYHVVRDDYFNIYFFYINSPKKPMLEVKLSFSAFGKDYLHTEFENLNLLKKLDGFSPDSIQTPLEMFEMETCSGVVLSYLSGSVVTELTDGIMRDSIIPWLTSFHKASKRDAASPEQLIESMMAFYQLYFNMSPKALKYVENMVSFFSRNGSCPTYFKHDDFNLENLLINGKKLRVKNFYYPMFRKLPMGELFFLYDRYYKRKKGRTLEKVFSFFGNSDNGAFSIDRTFLELVDPYIEEMEINRASINYLYFIHWIDYANNICSELIRITPEYESLQEEPPNFSHREKNLFWERMGVLHPGTLDIVHGTPAIIRDFFKD